jgi:anti-repressor protein
MDTLINIQLMKIGAASMQTINARDLHAFLENKQEFINWIKGRVEQYGFLPGQDFTIDRCINSQTVQIDYHISIDMAKELAMVERTAKGKQARQYFIESEDHAEAPLDPMKVLNDPAAMRGWLLTYSEKIINLQSMNDTMQPKVAALERIAVAEGSMCVTDAAKTLQLQPKDLFDYMQKKKWIHRRRGKVGWIAYQVRIQSGLLEHKVTLIKQSDGTEKVMEQVRILPKGLAKLAETVMNHYNQ